LFTIIQSFFYNFRKFSSKCLQQKKFVRFNCI
jgi:hypothetical protein